MKKSTTCFNLFLAFLKIGAFTFGGGYAMIPLIEREAVETHHWVSEEDILNIIAIAESTPGAIAVNSATFIGYRVAGILGALCATIGLVVPSFVIISILSVFIMQYKQLQWLSWVFDGIRAGVVVLILNAVIKMKKGCPNNLFSLTLMLAAFVSTSFFNADVILILVLAGIIGAARQLWLARKLSGGEGASRG